MAIAPDPSWQADPPPARPVLGAATVAFDALADSGQERLWALSDGEVTQAFAVLARLRGSVDAGLVAVLAEAKRRGLGTGDGWGPVDWARAHAPQLPTRTLTDLDAVASAAADTGALDGAVGDARLGDVVDAVIEAAQPCRATDEHGAAVDAADGMDVSDAGDADSDDPGGTDTTSQAEDHGPDVGTGALELGKAAQIIRFHRSVRGLAEPEHLAELTTITLRAARGPRALSERGLATALRHAADQLRPDAATEHDADVRRAHRSLVKGPGPLGMSRYTLLLDEEGAAILDTAVDALAKPMPDEATGAPDPRTPAARRADALLDLLARAAAAPDGTPRQAKTQLVVTTDLARLTQQTRESGRTLSGELLTGDTIRRLACDAEVIPMVLGSATQILDHGSAVRLFTPTQVRHLWLRDSGCTFPGCSKPPQWTDAQHITSESGLMNSPRGAGRWGRRGRRCTAGSATTAAAKRPVCSASARTVSRWSRARGGRWFTTAPRTPSRTMTCRRSRAKSVPPTGGWWRLSRLVRWTTSSRGTTIACTVVRSNWRR